MFCFSDIQTKIANQEKLAPSADRISKGTLHSSIFSERCECHTSLNVSPDPDLRVSSGIGHEREGCTTEILTRLYEYLGSIRTPTWKYRQRIIRHYA
jgi:hypothetical protein